jgi:hypothetical protein
VLMLCVDVGVNFSSGKYIREVKVKESMYTRQVYGKSVGETRESWWKRFWCALDKFI